METWNIFIASDLPDTKRSIGFGMRAHRARGFNGVIGLHVGKYPNICRANTQFVIPSRLVSGEMY